MATGRFFFRGNIFNSLGGRAYQIQSMHDSRVNPIILNSAADNIGRGDRNSDSILPYLQGSSSQTLLVKGFQYNNSEQVGNESNTGMEAFIMGNPFVGEENWCDGCRLELFIEDSMFENTVTDGIQLTNFGANSIIDIEIRNVQVINANPQQAGGPLGGKGNNRIMNNQDGSLRALQANPIARNNWWGSTGEPEAIVEGGRSSFVWQPVLDTDPR